jgi:hypothetical protein
MTGRAAGGSRVFSRRMAVAVATVCGVSLLVGLGLGIFQEELGVVRSAGADTFSYSALGHHGFKTLLEEMGLPVLVSRNESASKAGFGGVLVLAEPDLLSQERRRGDSFWQMCDQADRVLVVLPKRRGTPDPARRSFIESVTAAPDRGRDLVLDLLGVQGRIFRGGHSRDLTWDRGAWRDRPFIDGVQLIRADNLTPLIATEEGILLGQLRLTEQTEDDYLFLGDILVLSDPDLLANHGLRKGRNAEIALKAIEYLRADRGLVVFDETLHGHEVSASLLRAFFRLPLVFLLVQTLLAAAVLLWLATGRFGSPRRAPAAAERGLDYLIDNTAELLEYGGHGPFVLGRYFHAAVGAVCRRLHLEQPRTSPAARRRLVNITASRSPDFDFDKMAGDVPATALDAGARPQEVLKLARAIHRWQQ